MAVREVSLGPQQGPQEEFLSTPADIALYGGAAGGGKTYAILLDVLRHYESPEGGAVCFRRTSKQVRNEGGLWDTSMTIYPVVQGTPVESRLEWTFPKGFALTFAHLEHEKNVLDHQGSQIPVIYFDELTHFTEKQFTYMMSRNRSTSGIKPYIRATTNPDASSWVRKWVDWFIGDNGLPIPERAGKIRWFVRDGDRMEWADDPATLQSRFPLSQPKSFTFIPSKLEDNKILMDKDPSYRANLMALSAVERSRLLDGNWNVKPTAGNIFASHWFEEVEAVPPMRRIVRAWDRAATEWNDGDPGDPDWTVGFKLGQGIDGLFYILDIERVRLSAYKVDQLIRNTASRDGRDVIVKAFQDPGGAGKGEAEHFIRMMAGYQVEVEKIQTDKITSSRAASAQVEAGNVKVLDKCRNKEHLYDELQNFPLASHDDIVDGFTSAFNYLTLEASGHWIDSEGESEENTSLIQDIKW
jgi:predicted phage terminase large subunit-like protein